MENLSFHSTDFKRKVAGPFVTFVMYYGSSYKFSVCFDAAKLTLVLYHFVSYTVIGSILICYSFVSHRS